MAAKKSPLLVIFITVFIDLIGFGIILPLSPYLATQFGASAFEVGMLMAVYSFMQFVFSPIWGRLSDLYGRRPVILLSLLGTGLAHLAFGLSHELWQLFAARTLAGLFGGNISTAMAYVADVTDENRRSQGMGMVGAAFGLGFILGPFFGGVLGDFGMSYPAFGAAALCLVNFFVALRILKESLPPEKRRLQRPRENRFMRMFAYFRRPVIGPLLGVSFFTVFAFAHMEAVLFLLVKDRFGWGLTLAAFAFAYVGIVGAFTQGFLIRRLLPRFGERKLMIWGLSLSGIGLILIGYASDPVILGLVVTVMSLGVGLRNPSLMGMLSLKASASEQGGVMGVSQSLASLGRILGPPLGGYLYGSISPESPFVVAGLTTLISLPILAKIYHELPDQSLPSQGTKPNDQAKPVVVSTRAPGTKSPIQTQIEGQSPSNELMFIGEYQLSNLITQRVQFLFVDLRGPEARKPQVPMVVNSTMTTLIADVASKVPNKTFPIVVVCEDGQRSVQAANKLLSESFINVVVLRGGAPA